MAVILRKQPNGAIPEDVIEKIASEFGKSWGASYIEDGELQVGCGEDITTEMIQETQTNLLEDHAVLFFSAEKEEQPFALFTTVQKDDDGDNVTVPLISAYLEGNFKVKARDNTEHTSLEAVAAAIAKKVKLYMAAHEDDVSKAMEELRENAGDFENMIVDRGVIVVVANDGDVVSIDKGNTLAGTFDWGWMSNSLGFAKEVPQPQGTAGKVKSMFDKTKSKLLGNKGGSVPPTPPPAPAKETVVHAPAAPPEKKTDTAVPVNAGVPKDTATEMIWWAPDDTMSRSQKKDKYKTLGQSLTGLDWKANTPVLVKKELKDKLSAKFGGVWLSQEDMEERLKEKFAPPHQQPAKEAKPDGNAPAPDVKPEKAEPKEKEEPAVTNEILPILGPKALDATLKGEVLKTLDSHSVAVPDATTLAQMERKYPPVMKQLGRKEDAWLKWEYTGIRDLNAAHPDILPILLCDARLAMWRQAQTIADLQGQLTKLKSGGTKTLPEGVHEVKQPAPTAERKHKFGQGFKKAG